MAKKKLSAEEVVRFEADPTKGLTEAQVTQRIQEGLANVSKNKVEKSYGRIICDNLFTFFNIVLFSIAIIFLIFTIYLSSTGHADIANKYFGFSKFTFLLNPILNLIMGTTQEFHSKQILHNLRIVTEAKRRVLRDGTEREIPSNSIVLDDILLLKAGEQASCDVIILDGYCEVDESMLTGESDFVKKNVGDTIYSGSTVIVGSATTRVEKVGDDTLASTLSQKVKALSRHKSELMRNINRLINIMSIVLLAVVIVVIATLCQKIAATGDQADIWDGMTMSLSDPATWSRIIVTAGAFAIGVIPTGLVLITSVTLAVSIISLSRQRTMIQELYALENLSRVDVICLDKTGTLTDGTMEVVENRYFISQEEAEKHIRALLGAKGPTNQTSEALIRYYGKDEAAPIKEAIPFSSANKYSGIVYEDGRKLLLGAPEYLLEEGNKELEYVKSKASEGKRVLALILEDKPIALFVLKDNIRPSAPATLSFFYENGVDVKIISGDNQFTVGKIAEQCGVHDADKAISLEGVPLEDIPALSRKYTIFARVSPEQKQALVEALQADGHKVAMTGDGVNDILALRKANASISFANATDAAKSCADVVLLDNDFSHLTEVVGQGRRVVNNVQRSAVLFLMKTIAVFFLAFALIPTNKGQMWYSVENVYMLEAAVIGTGGTLMSLEGSKKPIRGSFVQNVYPRAGLAGVLVLIAAVLPVALYRVPSFYGLTPIVEQDDVRPLISLLTSLAGLTVTIVLCIPFNKWRIFTVAGTVFVATFLGFALPTSYIGGEATNAQMFTQYIVDYGPPAVWAPAANFAQSQFMHEFFQPWNSPAVRGLHINCLWVIIAFVLIALPLYYLGTRFVDKKVDGWITRTEEASKEEFAKQKGLAS